jgi:hypothetical protein
MSFPINRVEDKGIPELVPVAGDSYCLNDAFGLSMCMSNSPLQMLFGCRHRNTTFPQTPVRRSADLGRSTTQPVAQTYVACLDCGKELAYDWEKMRRVTNSRLARPIQAFRRAAFVFRLRSAS